MEHPPFPNFSLLSLSLPLRKPHNNLCILFFIHSTGDLGKELKNLITLMDQEEEAAQRTVSQKKNILKIPLI